MKSSQNIYCQCGNLILDTFAEEGDKCLYCQENEKIEKPLKSTRRDSKRNQWHTGFWK